MGRKFKFQVQDSNLEYSFWQCEKHIALSEKKSPLIITIHVRADPRITAEFLALHCLTDSDTLGCKLD